MDLLHKYIEVTKIKGPWNKGKKNQKTFGKYFLWGEKPVFLGLKILVYVLRPSDQSYCGLNTEALIYVL